MDNSTYIVIITTINNDDQSPSTYIREVDAPNGADAYGQAYTESEIGPLYEAVVSVVVVDGSPRVRLLT